MQQSRLATAAVAGDGGKASLLDGQIHIVKSEYLILARLIDFTQAFATDNFHTNCLLHESERRPFPLTATLYQTNLTFR